MPPARPRSHLSPGGARASVVLLAILVVVLLSVPGGSGGAAPQSPPAPSQAHRGISVSTFGAPTASAAAIRANSPLVTGIFDWDPQPFVLPPSFPVVDIAGLGAVMATSELYRTVVLFGGEGPSALTNLTITVDERTAAWKLGPQPSGPSPRANASFVTVDGGRYAVLFGGVVNLTTGASDNQTWVYDFQNGTWTNRTGPVAPPPREGAAMAASPNGTVAVLEGGIDPDYTVGGAGASITWNDTWLLNTTNFTWSRAAGSHAPRPMFGSSMIFDTTTGRFLLFGGCSSFCSNALYAYQPGGNWTREFQQGEIPSPRAAASETWSPNWNFSMLSGGFEWGGNSYAPYNDSFIYTPATHTWDLIASFSAGPSARFGSAAAFLAGNGCPGMYLVGGSSAVQFPPPDGWFIDTNPDYGSGCNNWGGDQVGGQGGPPANCTPTTFLNVTVRDQATNAPIPGAAVKIAGACGTQILLTDPAGRANFTAVPNDTLYVVVTQARYHLNSTFVNTSLPGSQYLTMRLDALPIVQIRVLGKSYPDLSQPIANASAFLAPSLPLGATDALGWLNLTGFAGPQGPNTFLATAIGYSNGSTTVDIPYTGIVSVPITVLAYGAFDVHIVEYPDGSGIAGATGVITPVGSYTFGGSQNYQTGGGGWFNTTLPQANYSVTASAPGFISNSTHLPVFHRWMVPDVVTIDLALLRGADLSVRLLDASTHQPIGQGTVRVGYLTPEITSGSGWANFTNILPPGWYNVVGSAPNYRSNSSAVQLTYLSISARVFLNLTPLPGCSSDCLPAVNGTHGPFRLLPSNGAALDAFILAPILLVLAGAVYALYVRRRAETPS